MKLRYKNNSVSPGVQHRSPLPFFFHNANLKGFQGQEMDNEIKGDGNSVNYKYRMHDPRLGSFFAVDPLSAKYPYYSPYAFSGNRVIDMVELEGLQPADYDMRRRVIEGRKARTGGITSSDLDFINQAANDRGFYLESDIPVLTNKPFSPYWGLGIKKSARDLGIDVMKDIHFEAEKKAQSTINPNASLHIDHPTTIYYVIPEDALVAIITPQQMTSGNGSGTGMFWNANATVSGVLNNNSISVLAQNFQDQIVQVLVDSFEPINLNSDYRIRIDISLPANSSIDYASQRRTELTNLATSNGFDPANIDFQITNSTDNNETITVRSGSNLEIIR